MELGRYLEDRTTLVRQRGLPPPEVLLEQSSDRSMGLLMCLREGGWDTTGMQNGTGRRKPQGSGIMTASRVFPLIYFEHPWHSGNSPLKVN